MQSLKNPNWYLYPRRQAGNIISFSNDSLKSLDLPHTDALVRTLQISNCEVSRVFIDPRAGVNTIFKSTLRNMGILEFEIVPCNVTLVGYDSNCSIALGVIPLAVKSKGGLRYFS